jgi:hypothetical protein
MHTSKLSYCELKVLHPDQLLGLAQRIAEIFENDLSKARLEYSVEMDNGVVSSRNCSIAEFPAVFTSSSEMTDLSFSSPGVYVSFTRSNKFLRVYKSINSDNIHLFHCLEEAVNGELNLIE